MNFTLRWAPRSLWWNAASECTGWGETHRAGHDTGQPPETIRSQLGFEIWIKLKITVTINFRCLRGKDAAWIRVCGFLFFAPWSLFSLRKSSFSEIICPIPTALFPLFYIRSLFSPASHLSFRGICFCLASPAFLSGTDGSFRFQLNLVSRLIVMEILQSSPQNSDRTTSIHQASSTTPVNIAQEIISLGFHVNEEHGEIFTTFYEIFMD